MEYRRLYVGGLSEQVLEKDIKSKFSEFATVKNVELRCKENYGNRRYFAYIDLEGEKSKIDTCVQTCNNLRWKGGLLKVQPAKESYLQTVQKDILDREQNVPKPNKSEKSTPKIELKKKSDSDEESESDDDPEEHLGVPAWKGFNARSESCRSAPSTSKKKVDPPSEPVKEAKNFPENRKRLYIGGLPESALEADIKKKFQSFGNVSSVEIKCKENYGNRRYFAYIDLHADENQIDECIRQCNNQTWRGAQLKVQLAKEGFLQKVQHEILERKSRNNDTLARQPSDSRDEGNEMRHEKLTQGSMDYSENDETYHDKHLQQYGNSVKVDNFNKRKSSNDPRDPNERDARESTFDKNDQRQQTNYSIERGWNQQDRPQRDSRPKAPRGAHYSRQDEAANTFESERNGLFDDIDAVDELGHDQNALLSDDEEKAAESAIANEPIFEKDLEDLFDGSESRGFMLSSLFADRLHVEEPSSFEDEYDRPTRKSRQESERFDEGYWKRAETVDQRSWQDMVNRHNRFTLKQEGSTTFFILPGDKRLEEGSEVFRTDEDPAQFFDCWKEQAEQLTQRLLQRKRNTRVQYQFSQRSTGQSKQSSGKGRRFRKAVRSRTT